MCPIPHLLLCHNIAPSLPQPAKATAQLERYLSKVTSGCQSPLLTGKKDLIRKLGHNIGHMAKKATFTYEDGVKKPVRTDTKEEGEPENDREERQRERELERREQCQDQVDHL